MAGTKKRVAKTQMVAVDACKLGQALKMTFEGVALVFDALGTDAGLCSLGKVEQAVEKEDQKKTEEIGTADHPETDDAAANQSADPDDDAGLPWDSQADTSDAEGTVGEPVTETGELDTAAEKSSAITLDDVTKIIVQKIKKNRSNNEKIGQILKAYGVAKVGELPDSKYEAFLTDLSEL